MKKPRIKTQDPEFYANREKWISDLGENLDVSHAAFRIAWFIAKKSNHEIRGMFWSVDKIANSVNCSTKTVSVATAELAKMGVLSVSKAKGRKNLYKPIFFWLPIT